MEYYRIILYILFGILPSLVWLFYYLKKDLHPEPKKMIVKVFLFGALATVPVFVIQMGLSQLLSRLQFLGIFNGHPLMVSVLRWFFIIALTEEVMKYAVAKITAFGSYEIDEPLDFMLYMVVSALGFAALENILYLFSPGGDSLSTVIKATIAVSFIRFIGATFLHTLCSALLGYFVALSCMNSQNKRALAFLGIFFAVLLHGLYDFSIMTLGAPFNFLIPVMIIIGIAVFIISEFDKIKKIENVCKV